MKSQEPQEKKFRQLSDEELEKVTGGNTISECENATDVELCKKFHIELSEVLQANDKIIDQNLPIVGPATL